MIFSASPDAIVDTYTATASFTLNGMTGTATQTIQATKALDGNRVSLMPWLLTDVPNVVINSITVSATMGQVDVTKTARLPVPGPTY